MKNIWIYDIETFVNYFGCIFKNPYTKEIKEFIIFQDRNDVNDLCTFISDKQRWFVGYNNKHFDDPILNLIYNKFNDFQYIFGEIQYTTREITQMIYDLATDIVNKEEIAYKYGMPFKSIDLMQAGTIGHKSLKLVAVNLKWHKIQDLPIDWNKRIEPQDLELLHDYNLNDVEITEALYYKLLPQLKLRGEISKLYNVNVMSETKSGIANKLLEKIYSELTRQDKRHFKKLRTPRKLIHFKHVINDNIVFTSQPLQELLEDMKTHIYYENQEFFRKNVVYDGVKYKLGLGGIHSDDEGGIFESDDEIDIIDCDIASMYPSIIINNKLCPAHLDKRFIKKYEEIRDDRIKAKKQGKVIESETMKIALNSVFGKTKNKYHWLYDPLVQLQITVNGQLYVLMLIEDLVRNGFQIISANTDGVITIVPKNRRQEYNSVCGDWEEYTQFILEYSQYSRYIRKDVNNYIAIKEDNSLKIRGDFLTNDDYGLEIDRGSADELMKGFDKPIVAIALLKYFLHNIPIRETIYNHRDIYDFCMAQKTDKKFTPEHHHLVDGTLVINKLQKSNRYYVSTEGGSLFKTSDEDGSLKRIAFFVDKQVRIFNDYVQHDRMDDYKIDYNYYISEAQKVINLIKDPQLKLF